MEYAVLSRKVDTPYSAGEYAVLIIRPEQWECGIAEKSVLYLGSEMVRRKEMINLTMELYLSIDKGIQAPGVVKPKIGGNVNFEIKSGAILDIVSLFNIPGVSHDAFMLRVFPITLTGASKRWMDRLLLGTVDSWDLLKKFLYFPKRAHLYKDCPLNEEIKSMEEVKYGEFGHPPKNINDSRFNKGGYDQPSSRERRPSLTEIINKYMEEASKRHTEQDEWLKKFYQSTKASKEAYDNIIQALETKTIYTEDGLPLYTPFYYSPEEIKYFSANSGFLDNERQETDDSGMAEALAALETTIKKKKEEPKREKQNDLIENKPRTDKEKEIKMNPRCSALLQNHLPSKEQDPGSLILLCSIGKLDFKNALADLGASISIMPFSMYKHFVILDMVEDIQIPIILERPLLATAHAKEVDIQKSYEEIVYKLTEVEKEKYSAPQEKEAHWCRAILQEKENERQYWASCNPNSNICNGGDLPINVEKHYWKSNNDSKREELEWENLSLNDWMRIRYRKVCKMTGERILKAYWRERFGYEEDDLEENLEDPEECGEDKANTILGVIHDKLNNDWFTNTSEDEDDLEGILDYLKPRSYE
ncbi:hypothetical protein Tco_1577649 [Tanacetum coccineum]